MNQIPASYLTNSKPQIDEKNLWLDPDKGSSGLLLADRILFYCQKALLIWPYDEQFVEPASYTLHAGREYLMSHRSGQIESRDLEKEGKVVIPPNGLIYIRFYEEVNLPYYMIARFNLRVTQVYRGLLLGTGPQVDPGYRGLLGCPIHNFTDEDKAIHFFDPLVTIDFEKTSPLGDQSFRDGLANTVSLPQWEGLRKGVTPVTGLNGLRCKIFNKRTNNPLFQSFLPPGESVRSSVHALHQRMGEAENAIKEFENTLTIYRRVAIVSVTLAIVVGYITFQTLVDSRIDSLHSHVATIQSTVDARVDSMKDNIVELSKAVGTLEERGTGLGRPTSSQRSGERLQESLSRDTGKAKTK